MRWIGLRFVVFGLCWVVMGWIVLVCVLNLVVLCCVGLDLGCVVLGSIDFFCCVVLGCVVLCLGCRIWCCVVLNRALLRFGLC